jgi:nicotinate-nucleotide adenylyltransferase
MGRKRRIGLLGGSFNPAHDGHRQLSLEALKRLALDEVWWLVSPQNPLKPVAGMAPLAERMAEARRVAAHPRIRVTDVETRLGTRYTVDTLDRLVHARRDAAFVWLMGADNLLQLPRWRDWRRIFELVPIAVFDRPSYSLRSLKSPAAQRFAKARLGLEATRTLAMAKPPAWIFVPMRLNPASATAIRAARAAKGGTGVASTDQGAKP